MAKIVSRGSAGCIAAMDQINPRIETFGDEPWVGVQLNVKWPRLISMYKFKLMHHPSLTLLIS